MRGGGVAIRQWLGRSWTAVRAKARRVPAALSSKWTAFTSLYAEPNAERVVSSYDQYAQNALGGNAAVFGVAQARLALFSEARLRWRDLKSKRLSYTDALDILERPWPNGHTGELLARMEQDVTLAGNAYVRNCGGRLERLRPDWVTIVSEVVTDALGHQVREVIGYIYDPIGDPDRDIDFYLVGEVAHWSPIPDPMANWRGMSWLTPCLREINSDLAMTTHREHFFRNAATPNIVIRYQGKLTPDRKTGLRDAIAARHAGPEKAGGTLVLDEGADLTIVGSNLRDVQFGELQAAGENRIAVAGGVPAIVAGLKEGLDSAAWSMYRQAMRRFADVTMRPQWRSACAALARIVTVPDGQELWFDVSDIAALQEGEAEAATTFAAKAQTASTLLTAGYTPESVALAVEAGDLALLVHTGMYSVQLTQPGTDPTPPAAATRAADRTPHDDALKHYWTKGEGLAKWASHPHPWTALRDHLRKHVGSRAEEIASQWFHDVFGIWPGEREGDDPLGPG
jgi:phage portal protein BeeE